MKEQPEHTEKLDKAEKILGHEFSDRSLLLTALTHPSAAEGHSISDSYERLEFLGDSILGAIVSYEAYHAYPNLDEGGLTRINVGQYARDYVLHMYLFPFTSRYISPATHLADH